MWKYIVSLRLGPREVTGSPAYLEKDQRRVMDIHMYVLRGLNGCGGACALSNAAMR